MTTATDNFNRANETPLAGNWTTTGIAMNLTGNVAVPSATGSDCGARYSGATWGNDQSSSAKLATTDTAGGGVGPGLLVRWSAAATTGYRLVATHAATNNIELSRFIAGAFTVLVGFTQAWTDGDTWELRVIGPATAAVLGMYVNGTLVRTFTDNSSIASGFPGIAYSSTAANATIDDWTGTDTFVVPAPAIESSNPTADNDTGGAATTGSTSAASHAVVLPATVTAGSLLMMFGRTSQAGAVAITGGGWTIVQNSDASVGPDVAFVAWRDTLAAGTEGGTSVTVTHGTGTFAAQTRSITGASNPAIQPPELASTTSVGETATMDAPALTPAGGAKNYLWFAVYTNEGSNPALDKTPPANYTLSDVDVRTGVAGNNWDNCQVKVCARQLNAATEDPGTVTLTVADNWLAYTVAVSPTGSASTAFIWKQLSTSMKRKRVAI